MGYAGQKQKCTTAEYFELEAHSEVRHEFFEGEIFAMAGASIAHNTIAGNCYIMLRQSLRGKKCRVQLEAVRLAIEEGRHYTYPDVMVSCDPADQRESQQLHRPVLIVEVLSPSTEAYDRGLKFKLYRQMPSLQHHVIVSQAAMLVEYFRRNEVGQWIITVLTEPQEILFIPELNLKLTLAAIYNESGRELFSK